MMCQEVDGKSNESALQEWEAGPLLSGWTSFTQTGSRFNLEVHKMHKGDMLYICVKVRARWVSGFCGKEDEEEENLRE